MQSLQCRVAAHAADRSQCASEREREALARALSRRGAAGSVLGWRLPAVCCSSLAETAHLPPRAQPTRQAPQRVADQRRGVSSSQGRVASVEPARAAPLSERAAQSAAARRVRMRTAQRRTRAAPCSAPWRAARLQPVGSRRGSAFTPQRPLYGARLTLVRVHRRQRPEQLEHRRVNAQRVGRRRGHLMARLPHSQRGCLHSTPPSSPTP